MPATPVDASSLRDHYRAALRWGRYWEAVNDADLFASLPGLSNAERAALLVEGSRARALVGDAEGVERDLRKALALAPGDAEASYRLAETARDRPGEAARYADQAARSAAGRRRAAAYRLAGEIRLDLGDEAGARTNLERALELSGEDLETLTDMVRVEAARPQTAAVFAARADRAAAAAPAWARPAAHLACARMRLLFGDFANAVAAAKRSLALEPDNLYALETLVRVKRESPEEPIVFHAGPEAPSAPPAPRSESSLMGAVRAEPADLAALGELVSLYRERKNLPQELAFAERFMDVALEAPRWQQPAAYRFIVAAWIDGGDREKLQKSLGLAKDLDRRSLEIEELTLRVGRGDFRAKTDPENMKTAYIDIARARAELKDAAGAEKSLKRALEIAPRDSEALRLLPEVEAGAPLTP